MVSRTQRVTGGTSPGKNRRLTPCLIHHTVYIVRSSYSTTHNLFSQMCYFLLLETKGFEHVGYVTMNSNYTQGPHAYVDISLHFFTLVGFPFRVKIYAGFESNS